MSLSRLRRYPANQTPIASYFNVPVSPDNSRSVTDHASANALKIKINVVLYQFMRYIVVCELEHISL